MTTVRALLAMAIPRLAEAGVETPQLDAELLLAHVLRHDRTWLLTHIDDAVPVQEDVEFDLLLERRLRREPLAYILGEWEFYGRRFYVSPDVLVPRPETELLVEVVIAWARAHRAVRLADIGTGSGNIAVTLAAELPTVQVTAVDLSPKALAIAQRNAGRHHVASRITFLGGDLLQPIRAEGGAPLEGIAANLPYIAAEEYALLMPEVRDYEPEQALLAEDDGLALIIRLMDECPGVLAPGGLLALEVGYQQAEAVRGLLAARGWCHIRVVEDYCGISRHVLAEAAS